MAWSAPPTWSVAQVVTAAQMTVLSDDLNYLKGAAGAVQIDNELDVVQATGATIVAQGTNNSAFARFRMLGKDGSGNVADWRLIADGGAGGIFTIYGGLGAALDNRFTIATNGNVAIGSHTPQGKLHGYDAISGFMHWKFDGVDGTARTVIPDGAGDVLYNLFVCYNVRASDGGLNWGTSSGVTLAPVPNSLTLYSSGANICLLTVNSNGSVTVQRTGGALTYKIGLWLLWL